MVTYRTFTAKWPCMSRVGTGYVDVIYKALFFRVICIKLVLNGEKNEVIFAKTEKINRDVIRISTASNI